MKIGKHTCTSCEFEIEDDSDYCPKCGTLFIEKVKCTIHPKEDSEGVCVICSKPFCDRCGHIVNNVYLCNEHDGYEIYEGLARVFGTSDEVQIQYIKNYLEENDLHPFIYSKKASPMHLGGSDYSLFRASGDFKIINEIKLMVPCGEVLKAEKLITEINT